MENNQLFRKLCKGSTLNIGWHLAVADSRNDFIHDPIDHADFAYKLTDRLNYLIEQIENDRYRPKHLIEVDIPKNGLSVRLGNVLPIEEASLLHAIIYLVAQRIDKYLDDNVYSYRLANDWEKKAKKGESMFRDNKVDFPFLKKKTIRSIDLFDSWYDLWPEFEKDSYDACTTQGYTHLTKTDIVAYFENIDLQLLQAQLRSLLKNEDKILSLLFRVLAGWTRSTSSGIPIGRGIPQGNEVSSFLGNIYLMHLDNALNEYCRKNDAMWCRYMDDVKVYTRNMKNAREVVFIVNDALRQLHLNIQGSKTEIYSGDNMIKELHDPSMDKVGAVFDEIKIYCNHTKPSRKEITGIIKKLSPIASEFRRKLPFSVQNITGKNNRLFRRLLTVYGWCQRTQLKRAALTALKELPDLKILQKTLSYLKQLDYKEHQEISKALLVMLDKDELLFPYQKAAVLETMIFMHPHQSESISSCIRKMYLGKKHDWLIVQKAIEAIITYPCRSATKEKIACQYIAHNNPMVRRAACVLILQGSRKHKIRNMLKEISYHPDHGLNRLALYLLRHFTDENYAGKVLSDIRRSNSDLGRIKTLYQLYAISLTQDKKIAMKCHDYIMKHTKTKSKKLQWHYKNIEENISWAITPKLTGSP